MKLAIIAAGFIGGTAVKQTAAAGYEIVRVIAPNAEDRAALAARELGLPLTLFTGRNKVIADDIPDGIDVLFTIGSTAYVGAAARRKARIAALGYHPSLLPRHRGVASVEWTVKCGDAIAGGSVYHLGKGFDDGDIALQDWCHVKPGETAPDLWRRALTPIGLSLMAATLKKIREDGTAPHIKQDEIFATLAPALPEGA